MLLGPLVRPSLVASQATSTELHQLTQRFNQLEEKRFLASVCVRRSCAVCTVVSCSQWKNCRFQGYTRTVSDSASWPCRAAMPMLYETAALIRCPKSQLLCNALPCLSLQIHRKPSSADAHHFASSLKASSKSQGWEIFCSSRGDAWFFCLRTMPCEGHATAWPGVNVVNELILSHPG